MAQHEISRGTGDLITDFRQEMNKLFSQFIGAGFPNFPITSSGIQSEGGRGETRAIAPRTDISEDDSGYRIVLEVPGIDPKNVEVEVSGQTLTVRAQHQEQQQKQGRTYLLAERNYGAIQRQFRIPEDVDATQISAEFRHGILALNLRKSQQSQQQRRRIEIKTN